MGRPVKNAEKTAGADPCSARSNRGDNPPRRIICGTDFSAHAAEAADVAAALAAQLKCPLSLIHVASRREDALGAQERLRCEANRLRSTGIVGSETILFGSPYEALASASEAGSAALIVVSSMGSVARRRFLVGSTAERTAELARVPTLVVRAAGRLLEWAQGGSPLQVCVGDDMAETSNPALIWAAALGVIAPCVVTVVHVASPRQNSTLDERGCSPEATLKDRVERVVGGAQIRVRIVPSWGRADSALLAAAIEERAELIVVGSRQRHRLSRLWLGSVSRGVLHDSTTSVVVVPAPLATKPNHVGPIHVEQPDEQGRSTETSQGVEHTASALR